MEKQTYFKSLCSLLVAVATLVTVQAHATPEGFVSLGKFKNAKGEMVDVTYKRSPKAKLQLYRPSHLLSEGHALRAQIGQQCKKSGNAVVNFALKQYPVESTTFNLAVGLAAGDQLREDPAYARHFIENSYLDPMGHVSFMGFMLGNRASASLFSMMNLTYDPCRILKRNPLAPVEALEQREFQKYMEFVTGPVGMAAGMLLSDVGRELLTDQNIRLCARFQIGAVHGAKARSRAVAACDQAYNDWVIEGGDKIRELVPDMINMGAVVTLISAEKAIRSKVLTPLASNVAGAAKRQAMKAVDEATLRFATVQSARYWVWEGIDFTVSVASKIPTPATRFGAIVKGAATSVAGIYVFNWLQDELTPYVKKPYQIYQQSSQIQSTLTALNQEIARTRANNWIFKEQPKPVYCDPKVMQQTMRAQAMAGGVPYIPSECYEAPQKPADLILNLGKQEKKWRDFIMTDTMTAANNWSDYVLHFANMYTDARKFYFDIMKRVWTLRFRPNEPEKLKERLPLGGVDVDLTEWTSRKACDLPQLNQELFKLAVDEINKQIVDSQKPTIKMPTLHWKPSWGWDGHMIHPNLVTYENNGRLNNPLSVDRLVTVKDLVALKEGFKAVVCSYKLENISRDLHKDEKLATPQEIELLRWQRYFNSLNLLYLNLNAYPHFNNMAKESDPNGDEYDEYAATNVYMRVNKILSSQTNGSPEPVAPGVGYVKSRRYDPADIVQSMKDDHPMTFGENFIDTAFMPEYLLASMLCGPYHEGSVVRKAVKVPNVSASLRPFNFSFGSKQVGWSVEFHPPRVIPEIGVNICGDDYYHRSTKGGIVKRVQIGRPSFHVVGAEIPHLDPYRSEWVINGKRYRGMLEILEAFAHPDVVGDAKGSNVVQWWSKNLGKRAEPLFKGFRAEFVREVLNKKFVPAIRDGSRTPNVGFLGARSMPKGMTAAVTESMNEHLAMLDQMIRNHKLSSDEEKKYQELYKAVRDHFAVSLQFLLPTRLNQQAAAANYANTPEVELNAEKMKAKSWLQGLTAEDGWDEKMWSEEKALPRSEIKAKAGSISSAVDITATKVFLLNQADLRKALSNLQDFANSQVQGPSKQTVEPLIDAVMTNLANTVTDLDSYHGFLVSIRLDVGD